LGCWISPCFGPLSFGASFETYEMIIYLIFQFFFQAVVNRGYGSPPVEGSECWLLMKNPGKLLEWVGGCRCLQSWCCLLNGQLSVMDSLMTFLYLYCTKSEPKIFIVQIIY